MVATSVSSQPSVVLVIDPDPAIQRDMRDRLVALGYSARSVDDYESALGVVSATPPDLILLTGNNPRSEAWSELQAELGRWGIPMLDLGATDANKLSTSPLPEDPAFLPAMPDIEDEELKLRVDTALQSRTLQDALMTENVRLAAERLHDPLTGLFNRRYIMIRVEEEIQRSSRRTHPLSCMLIDLDGFDKVNEEWGLQMGDSILRDAAHLLTRTLRASDICCRYRDDQFLVLLTDTDASGAQIAANRVRDAIAGHSFYNQMSSEPIKLTASVGVAYWQPGSKLMSDPATWEPQLIGLSERALKAAKQSGANRLVILQAT
jgi:two-component system, cell cycle response regulator